MSTRAEQQQKLIGLKETLEAELGSIALFNPETGDWQLHTKIQEFEADEDLIADHLEAQETEESLLSALEKSHRDVLRALEKIMLGTYGFCEVCGGLIAPSRLEILPSARTCSLHLEDEINLPL
jgi:RNA polymerase-binding transcription factor DksA